jgi:methyltransferase (TIGR00027 family)
MITDGMGRDAVVVAGAKPSRSARGVVAERALLTDMGVVADPFARRMLSPSMAAFRWIVQQWAHRVPTLSVTLAGLAARVLWYDAHVAAALDAGVQQIAVVGAGYDSRAWRFRRDGVAFFELDQGPTQQDKARRAPGPGPTYVEADLTTQSAAATLGDRGLDPARPALFILEGVTMYLSEKSVRQQLAELSKTSAVGSRLTTDFYPPREIGTARHRRQLLLQRLARVGSGEGLELLVGPPQAVELVESSGWTVGEATSLHEAARALVPRASGLPVDAVNEQKTLVSASRS